MRVLIGVLLMSSVAFAGPSEQYRSGIKAYKTKNYTRAAVELTKAWDTHEDVKTAFYLMLTYFHLLDSDKAMTWALTYMVEAAKLGASEEHQKQVAETKDVVNRLRARLEKPALLSVGPNCHKALLKVGKTKVALTQVDGRQQGHIKPGGATYSLTCAVPKLTVREPNGWARAYPWLLGAGAMAGVGAVSAWVLRPDLGPPPTTDTSKDALVDHFSSTPMGNLAIGLSISGAVLLSAGGLAWMLSGEEDEKAATWLTPAPGGLVFGGSF